MPRIFSLLVFVFLCLPNFACAQSAEEKPLASTPTVRLFDPELDAVVTRPVVEKTDEEWKQLLDPEVYHITREQGTERAFTGKYHDSKKEGLYFCTNCQTALYASKDKYDSGTGWPSYTRPISEHNIRTREDNKFFMKRTEVICARCHAHLGHVFKDGPAPTYTRHCINSAALDFKSLKD